MQSVTYRERNKLLHFAIGSTTNIMDTLNTFEDVLEKLLKLHDEGERKAKEILPKVIAAKRKKFLQAIGADDQLDRDVDANMDDEHLLDIELENDTSFTAFLTKPIIKDAFDDSIVVNSFKNVKIPEFDLKTYISCVKNLYNDLYVVSSNLCYLLWHARDFSAPRNRLFTSIENGVVDAGDKTIDIDISDAPQSPFTAKLVTLMDELLTKYSEAKYQQLNMNVTYLILLMTRKSFNGKTSYINALKKPKTHEDFVNLCPQPLHDRLPDDAPLLNNEILIQNTTLFTLILYAYMNSARRTRRVLVTTCIKHMEYTGLGLPMMFDKLVQLYQVPEGRLWDAFCVDKCESMFALADFHDSQRAGEKQVPPKTYTLFPYCRVLSGNYHGDLSCKNNKMVCYAMALLIDKKIGLDKSHMRDAHWAKEIVKTIKATKARALAEAVFEIINK